ncbi:MAG: holdfast anchor protein HfaD [Caulobacteraceae bacterium]|nr:holdfast anchor protein HfaD [Caulobacteraceae bacterium]
MARPAPSRLAGTIAAMAMCAAAATEAAAQDPSRVLNQQLQLGDVISGVTLNVEDASGEVPVTNTARGNQLSGSVDGVVLDLASSQTLQGVTAATTTITLTGDTRGALNATTDARGNDLASAAYGGDLSIESSQTVGPTQVTAAATIGGPAPRLIGGASVSTTAIANAAALGATGSAVSGVLIQNSDAGVRADILAETQYIPATAEFISQSTGNQVAANSWANSGQALTLRQRQSGDVVTATTSANAGNAWDLAGRARATANQSVLYNQGGSAVVTTDQSNLSRVRADSVVTSYDFGAATARAAATANEVSIGNNDRYLEIDNAQVNSGGVEASASFAGTNGYDAYVAAESVGNSVVGYACAQCAGEINVTNTQTNSAGVLANATTTIAGSGRSVATSASAVGNSATFYVSGPRR